jgi:hydroxymethylpyrimidine pyrophosphatase-like HAD family hydrolase
MNTFPEGQPHNRLGPRLIAIDLDGTLLTPAGEVSARSVKAVRAVVAAGYRVCFATGRNWTESRAVVEAVDHHGPAVFVGGAVVVDTRDGRVLHHAFMHPSLAADVCRFFERRGQAAMALQDTAVTGVDYLITDGVPIGPALQLWMDLTRAAYRRVPDLAGHAHQHTIRVSVVNDPAATASLSAGLAAEFGSRIVFHTVAVPSHGVDVLEVFDPTVNKWQGLLRVAAELGVDPADTIAIGDDVNDIPMLRGAGLGVAMGNARPDVKAAAKRVIGPNADDGLAAFLEELAAGG